MKRVLESLGMGTYRRRLDIVADILNVASKDSKKTQIMYQANLSYKVLQKYLTEVVDSSLISFEGARHCYQLTDKGKRFLEAYQEYSRSYKHIEKRLNDVKMRKKNLQELCPGSMS